VNSQTIARASWYTKFLLATVCVLLALLVWDTANAFEIDLSRRRKATSQKEGAQPSVQPKSDGDLFLDLFNPSEPKQELVILNTEKGFVPAKVALRKGSTYTIHIVNVNEKEKNVSFILDSFSEHHSTFYGKMKSFEIKPAEEGVFTYQCPETSFDGKFVVFTPDYQNRGLATDKEK
jgi:hypothetical protein